MATEHEVQGEAVRIIKLDEKKNRIISDNDTLQQILQDPKIKDKDVCVISITGAFRQGKSFLLNFLLQYLEIKYEKNVAVTENWLQFAGEQLQGFQWKYGPDRHTSGILMWSNIFTAQLPSGEEVAIILLDTQGTFDNATTMQQNAAIFAISTLISSVQIFNLKGQIDQNHLQTLECFSGFGEILSGQKSNGPPFQSLWFLIRDWQFFERHSFGEDGGEEYLNSFFNNPNQPEELKRQNNNILNLFKNLNCFLLPHPGKIVATKSSFQGNFADIDKKFLNEVQNFASAILAPENLVAKIINGNRIKAGNLVGYIQRYCDHFMDNKMPKLETMYMATALAHLDMILSEAKALYEDKMNKLINDCEVLDEEELNEEHTLKKYEAIDYFKGRNTMGDKEVKESYKKKLIQILDGKFDEYKKINKIKLVNQQALNLERKKLAEKEEEYKILQEKVAFDNMYNKALKTAEQLYTSKMNQVINDASKALTQNELNNLHRECKSNAIDNFTSSVKGEKIEIKKYTKNLSTYLDNTLLITFEKINNTQLEKEETEKLLEEEQKKTAELNDEHAAKKLITEAEEEYDQKMTLKTAEGIEQKILIAHHSIIKNEIIKELLNNAIISKNKNKYLKEINGKLEKKLKQHEKINKSKLKLRNEEIDESDSSVTRTIINGDKNLRKRAGQLLVGVLKAPPAARSYLVGGILGRNEN